MKRREFLKSIAAAGAICAVPKVLGSSGEVSPKLMADENPVVNGWDNRPHYPVWKNHNGDRGWDKKSAYDIATDIIRGANEVRAQLHGNFSPDKHEFTIGIPHSKMKYLKKKFVSGIDVEGYIRSAWPKAEIWHGYPSELLSGLGYNLSAEFFVEYLYVPDDIFLEPIIFSFSQYGI